MMLILKVALLVMSLGFLIGTQELASMAPLVMLAGALVIWWLDQQEPPRLFAWIAIAAGAAVAVMKGAPFLFALIAAAILLYGLEWMTRRRGLEDPPGGALLLAVGAAGLAAWLGFTFSSGGGSALVSQPRRIVAIGDSLTSGLPGEGFRRWPDLLAEQVGAEAVNLSYPGDTVSQSLARWSSRFAPRRWHENNPTWEPDLIVVVIGGNDIRARAQRSQLKRELSSMIELLKPQGAPILLVSVPGGLVTDEYAGLWREVAQEQGVAWMSEAALRRIFTTPRLTTDGIHFNAEGHREFAIAVARRIRGG